MYLLPQDERIKRVRDFLTILLKEGWAYPRRANNFTMAEHKAAIMYAGEKMYPVWKLITENYSFELPEINDETQKHLKAYTYPEDEITADEIDELAQWLVIG